MCFERNIIFYTLWGQICIQEREEAKQHKLLKILARSLGARRQTSEFHHIRVPSLCLHTPPNLEIICGQNVGTKEVCGMILFLEKKATYAENLKKIVGAV